MSAERRGNPFGWILLGFAVGVLATFGVILFLTAGLGGYDEGPEMRTAADDAAAAAIGRAAAAPAPRKIEAPVVVAPPAVTEVPARETPPVDAQMADDAAAAGMTSRAGPER
jgi:hypothetical protein